MLIFSVLRETLIFSALRLGTRRRRRKTLLKKRKKRKKKKNGRYKNACVVIVKEGTREKRKIFFLGQEKNTLFSWGGGLDYHQSEALTLWPVFFCFLHRQVAGNISASSLDVNTNGKQRNYQAPHPTKWGGWAGTKRRPPTSHRPRGPSARGLALCCACGKARRRGKGRGVASGRPTEGPGYPLKIKKSATAHRLRGLGGSHARGPGASPFFARRRDEQNRRRGETKASRRATPDGGAVLCKGGTHFFLCVAPAAQKKWGEGLAEQRADKGKKGRSPPCYSPPRRVARADGGKKQGK